MRPTVVAIDDAEPDIFFATISVDDRSGGREATEHLIGLGKRRIAYVGSGETQYHFARERYAGYQDALETARLTLDPNLVVTVAMPWDESVQGFAEVDEFLGTAVPFEAVFFEFDVLAAVAFRSFRHAGVRVPEDVAVVGYDNDRAASLIDPMLTTMRRPHEEMATRAVDLLHAALNGASLPVGRELVKPTLVIRQSA